MGTIRYIADMHFGYEAIIAYDNRPFLSLQEMDEAMIEKIELKDEDRLYILGDVIDRGPLDRGTDRGLLHPVQGARRAGHGSRALTDATSRSTPLGPRL